MATIKPFLEIVSGGNGHVYTWVLSADDDGEPIEATDFANRLVQIEGNFDGGSVVIEGSNDSVNYRGLNDPQGNDVAVQSPQIRTVAQMTRLFRPRVVGGTPDTQVTVCLFARFAAWRYGSA